MLPSYLSSQGGHRSLVAPLTRDPSDGIKGGAVTAPSSPSFTTAARRPAATADPLRHIDMTADLYGEEFVPGAYVP